MKPPSGPPAEKGHTGSNFGEKWMSETDYNSKKPKPPPGPMKAKKYKVPKPPPMKGY